MKILTVKNVLKAAALLSFATASNSFADLALNPPLDLSDPFLIGTIDPVNAPGDAGNSLADDAGRVQVLLNLTSADAPFPFTDAFGREYDTAHADDFGGTIDTSNLVDLTQTGNTTAVPAGWDLVFAKYGNGAIVIFLGGEATTLPDNSLNFSFNGNGPNGNGFSSWRVYNGTEENPIVPPEGTPTPDGGATMLLLGGGISALALIRRKLS